MRSALGRRLSALGSVLVLVAGLLAGPFPTPAQAQAAPDQTAPELAAAQECLRTNGSSLTNPLRDPP